MTTFDGNAATFKPATRICAVLTAFNRREKTLESLRALSHSAHEAGVDLRAVLVDDGSNDGTAEAVREQFPWARVVVNTGPALFWCRGMHRALAEASTQDTDHFLMLNDDTTLYPDAVARLLACEAEQAEVAHRAGIVVGSTRDAATGRHTYGGERVLQRNRPLSLTLVAPNDNAQAIDTFNGNIVLLPGAVFATLGNLDPTYEHAMGDIDYGFRAVKAGVPLWLAPGYLGTCSNNPTANTHADTTLPLRRRMKLLLSRKGVPWRSWLHFTRLHAGWAWPAFFVWPYVRLVREVVVSRLSRVGHR